MSTYKLLALDMDGTLLDEHSKISEENAKWIHAALDEGVTVMFSTGRGVQSALPYAEELKLRSPIVAVNGSDVWKEPHVLLKRVLMDVQLIRSMHELAVEYDRPRSCGALIDGEDERCHHAVSAFRVPCGSRCCLRQGSRCYC